MLPAHETIISRGRDHRKVERVYKAEYLLLHKRDASPLRRLYPIEKFDEIRFIFPKAFSMEV
jgi:hypothetical protein